jgi:carbonic anhydrase
MKKLIQGIVKFRRNMLPGYRETFAHLALGQAPDALFIGCSDSRVAVNVFASTDPGDLFVLRNVGNIVPAFNQNSQNTTDESEAVAIEFSLNVLNVSNIIVCGHSECGAMQALVAGRDKIEVPKLKAWLRHGDEALEHLKMLLSEGGAHSMSHLAQHNQLSQLNVLKQLEHVKSYPVVQERLKSGKLTLHAWWFELSRADVYAYEESAGQFVIIDEDEATRILERIEADKSSR